VLLLGHGTATPEVVMIPDEMLEVSAERDRQLALRLNAWRDGYRAALGQIAEAEARGYARAVAEFKAAHHGVIADIQLEHRRWDGPREHFGKARPTDYPGKRAAA
jgi:hypothetical protein